MKRLLFLATIALALFSCKDYRNVVIDSKESIEASPTSLSFAAQDAEAQVVQLTVSDGTKWTAVCSNVTAVVEVSQDAYVAPEPIEGNVVPDPAPFDGTKRSNTTYQLLVYTFADSDGDKIGDFKGIQNKLDYLDELGVNALWLSPIHPSDSYHGYDITDYNAVNPVFGTETDLENLINAAHAKDIKIYLDYVLNHYQFPPILRWISVTAGFRPCLPITPTSGIPAPTARSATTAVSISPSRSAAGSPRASR